MSYEHRVATSMKLSFIIPAYNEENYIETCLKSVIGAKKNLHENSEIIVVNNASTDRTEEIAKSFSEVRLVNEPKKGITHARAAGARTAEGEFIANIDADTMISKSWPKKALKKFEKNKNLVCVSGPLHYYDCGKITNFLTHFFYKAGAVFQWTAKHLFQRKELIMVQGGASVVKREVLEHVGGFDTSIQFYGEDTGFGKKLSEVGEVQFCFDLLVRSSGRRLKEEGVIRTGFRYALNNFWINIFNKPFHTTSRDIRK